MTHQAHPLFAALTMGDRGALGRAITLMESDHPKDLEQKLSLLASQSAVDSKSVRIAITGAPGVGKSSLIELLGLHLIEKGHRVAVLAVDPSSNRTGGSILGDKTRMPNLSRHPAAFIRPSPTSGVLGGVAEMTRETIFLCESAGYDRIIVETVGIGQSETHVATLTDIVLFVTMVGSGDSLQGIKRGILEVIDIVAVNKSDGLAEQPSKQFASELASALHLLHGSNRPPSVWPISTVTQTGLSDLWTELDEIIGARMASGAISKKRIQQLESWFDQATQHALNQFLIRDSDGVEEKNEFLAQAKKGLIHPFVAANQLVQRLLRRDV
ncbi:MAG: methylmalonyl Co-A mutase-associated GTPase MeaB [Bacteroidetes bacterium]|nr:methylmalonyl Co-A mutase-associated GTPase MeaB [Bacteroidota bacterium]